MQRDGRCPARPAQRTDRRLVFAVLFVDNDRALAGGRELNGQPKRLAEVSLEARSDLHVATLTRNGIVVFTGTMAYKPSPATLMT